MKTLKEIEKEIDREIRERKDLLLQMVGGTYPRILQNEIELLERIKYEFRY